ncbi:MAG: HlyD family efflux transporter periplasmic adaptor subunit [Muribaculaceae bacterium]|nr:HlyD family efflux transporter periplasmic adaptor subunit [Muribaculaceae bacterium]
MDVKIERPKGIKGIKTKHWIYAGCGLIAVVLIVWLAMSDIASTLKVDRSAVNIADVKSQKFDDYVRVDGRVEPISTVQISPEEGGIVMEKVVEEGAQVHKGDIIIRLSNSNLDLQILNAEAELAEKQNILRNTQISMEQDRLNNRTEQAQLALEVQRKQRAYLQQKKLYDDKLIAREDYIQAKEDYELAMKRQTLINQRLNQDSIYRLAQVDQMEDNLANMQKNIQLIRQRKDRMNVVSPIDGELGLLDVELGQNITAGQKIGQINDLTNYKVTGQIDEHYIDRVHKDLLAKSAKTDQKLNMRLRKVFPEVREGKFKVEFVFTDKCPENIRSGQTCYLSLQLGQPVDAVVIPKGSFYATTGGKWIFVLDSSGKKAYRRNIRLGRQNPEYYDVLEGLEPGERVITNGYESYGDATSLTISE